MLTAKLLVPLGAPLQLKAGETLPPAQPKPLNTCSLTMVSPSLRSELVKVMFCAIAALEPKHADGKCRNPKHEEPPKADD